jgi:hypothetical protein
MRPDSAGAIFRIGRLPQGLLRYGDLLESRFGRLGRDYGRVAFDKEVVARDPTVEWVTPGHPLFESIRAYIVDATSKDVERGAIYWDANREGAAVLDVFEAALVDGIGRTLHRRLFVVESDRNDHIFKAPTVFQDLVPATDANGDLSVAAEVEAADVERWLTEQHLAPWLAEAGAERAREVAGVRRHVEISLDVLIDRQQRQLAEFLERRQAAPQTQGIEGLISQAEHHLDDLVRRLDSRREQLDKESRCTISGVRRVGRALVLPHPRRNAPEVREMIQDDEIERIAIEHAKAFETQRGWRVESVESENRGFDLISRLPASPDDDTTLDARFIEVKGRALAGEVGLTLNEYETARRLKDDYWLYVVFNCASTPELRVIRDPARLGWQPVALIEHYALSARAVMEADKAPRRLQL